MFEHTFLRCTGMPPCFFVIFEQLPVCFPGLEKILQKTVFSYKKKSVSRGANSNESWKGGKMKMGVFPYKGNPIALKTVHPDQTPTMRIHHCLPFQQWFCDRLLDPVCLNFIYCQRLTYSCRDERDIGKQSRTRSNSTNCQNIVFFYLTPWIGNWPV